MSLPLLTGCISAGANTVVRSSDLRHWWKMNEGSTVTATDYGRNAETDTNASLANVTSAAGGPSVIGTPSYLRFNGTDAYGRALGQDSAGVDTALGTTLTSTDLSVCFWFQNFYSSSPATYKTIYAATPSRSWTSGLGAYFLTSPSDFWKAWLAHYTGISGVFHTGVTADWVNRTESDGGDWAHCAMVLDSTANTLTTYVNGTQRDSSATTGDPTAQLAGNSTAGAYLLFGAAQDSATNGAFAVNYHSNIGLSDFRIYDVALSSTEVGEIASGDWT